MAEAILDPRHDIALELTPTLFAPGRLIVPVLHCFERRFSTVLSSLSPRDQLGRLLTETELHLAKVGPALGGEAETQCPEHGETARDAPRLPPNVQGSSHATIDADIFCHANNLNAPVGHRLSDR
jgi:hypothetical protein